ncbi:MAG: K(+)/H(+) antiporter [Sclerophora amabilis]|nr:MAG: K(+)/H(+) antiporter [Sclerophora amabilis]
MSASVTSAAAPSPSSRAPSQGGILEGADPTKYDLKNPITIFIIQAGIIIIFCRVLEFPLSKLRQPRVIAEVIGGILLGPSVMGRIPGFSEAIFPKESMPNLSLVANLGLILFLFLVGLEVDMRLFLTNWRVALSVGAAGMVLPFGLGCAIAYGLFNQFRGEEGTKPIEFGVFMLFIGVAMAITVSPAEPPHSRSLDADPPIQAFPVLCRILTELKLLGTDVGVTVLAAGVGNDVVGWILLALCVALVNAGSGISALWVLLTSVAWVLFLVYAVRPGFLWLLRRTGSIHNGPTQSVVGLTLLMVLTSAFFTQIIGIHAIFGGFLVGLICPHDGGFAIKLTEKIEDLVGVLFLPLYFALSGLSTNIGLLDTGITWAYVIGVTAVAFFAKIAGGTLAARVNKLVWRESLTIGVLMSCKGLVELIVLNIGLNAKILGTRTFTIFVVMALVTTFATTPLTSALYPPSYQKKLGAWKRGEIDWDGNRLDDDDSSSSSHNGGISIEKFQNTQVRKLLLYLRLDSLPSLLTFISLLGGDESGGPSERVHRLRRDHGVIREEGTNQEASDESAIPRKRPLEVHGLRMIELTERTSSVMKGSEVEESAGRDPVVNIFRTFGKLNNVAVSGGVSVVPEGSYAETMTSRASDLSPDLILIPWSETGNMSEGAPSSLLPSNAEDQFTSGPHNHFIQSTLANATCNTAIFVNRGFGGSTGQESRALRTAASRRSLRSNFEAATTTPVADRSHHVFFPYFGGADDHVALRFVLQLAQNPNVTATILHVQLSNHEVTGAEPKSPQPAVTSPPTSPVKSNLPRQLSSSNIPTTTEVYDAAAPAATQGNEEHDKVLFSALRDSLPSNLESRVVFEAIEASQPLRATLARAKSEVGLAPRNAGDLVVLGRGRGMKGDHIRRELIDLLSSLGHPSGAGSEARKSLGDMAEAMIVENVKASVLVIQAAGKGLEL